jgi:hypothetical protein
MAFRRASKHCLKTGIGSCCLIPLCVVLVSCAAEKSTTMQQPSREQVKGSADRSFDKLKQEEQERKTLPQ